MKRLAIAVLLVCAFSAAQAGSLEDGMHHLNNKAYASAMAAFRLAAARGSAAAERQIGFMHYQGLGLKQSNTDAVAWFERAANDGDLQSQINLGQMYENGMSVVQSDTRAAHWYGLAAMQGDRRSQLRYGEILFLGAGVARGPLVVSCGTQQSESLVVVEPGGHVGRLPLSLSTCPRGRFQEYEIERWSGGVVHQRVGIATALGG